MQKVGDYDIFRNVSIPSRYLTDWKHRVEQMIEEEFLFLLGILPIL